MRVAVGASQAVHQRLNQICEPFRLVWVRAIRASLLVLGVTGSWDAESQTPWGKLSLSQPPWEIRSKQSRRVFPLKTLVIFFFVFFFIKKEL